MRPSSTVSRGPDVPDREGCILCSNTGPGCPHHPRPARRGAIVRARPALGSALAAAACLLVLAVAGCDQAVPASPPDPAQCPPGQYATFGPGPATGCAR